MITLPNGKSIDRDMLETAMEDSDLANRYFLNLVTGEVVFFSDYLGLSDEDERLSEEIDGSNDYVAIERIPSHEAYQWMVDFVDEMVAPADEYTAEKLSMALNGNGIVLPPGGPVDDFAAYRALLMETFRSCRTLERDGCS